MGGGGRKNGWGKGGFFFADLPPYNFKWNVIFFSDLSLARVELEGAKMELKRLENLLSEDIDLMHM